MKTKHLILSLLIFLASSDLYSQTYSYQAIDLDTTCFWVSNFRHYYGFPYYDCRDTKTTIVEKDTFFNGYKYFKLRTYTSDFDISSSPINQCYYLYSQNDQVFYVREDTTLKRLVSNYGTILVDFQKNIGDTIDIGLSQNNPVIDSITIDSINGTPRRQQWFTYLGLAHKTIEGIGIDISFPQIHYGEWGTLGFELQCYSKNGIIQWKLFPNDTCQKKSKYILSGISNVENKPFKIYSENRLFKLVESNEYPVTFRLKNILGNCIQQQIFTQPNQLYIEESISSGYYFIELFTSKKKEVIKLQIE